MLQAWSVKIDDHPAVIVHTADQEDAVREVCEELGLNRWDYECYIVVERMQRIYDGSYVPAY